MLPGTSHADLQAEQDIGASDTYAGVLMLGTMLAAVLWVALRPLGGRASFGLLARRLKLPEPIVLVLGGLASYWGVAAGAIIMWTILEGTRFIDLPITAEREAAVRFMIVGLILILLMAFRPQGLFGKKEEMVLGD